MSNQNQIKYWPSGNVNNRNGRIILNKTLVDKKKKLKQFTETSKIYRNSKNLYSK